MAESIRVLLVEDDEDDYLITRDLLRDVSGTNYQLAWSNTMVGGLEALMVGKPAVVLIDYHLGAWTGVDFLNQAREKGFDQPIIMLTGEGDGSIDEMAMGAGAADYLIKGQITAAMLDRSIRYSLEHARTLARLRSAEAEYRTIFEGVTEGIVRMRPDGWLLLANSEMARIFGYSSAAELLEASHSRPRLKAKSYSDGRRWQQLLKELKAKGQVSNFESEIVSPTGPRWINEQLSLVKDADGKVLYLEGTVQDITARKQAEADYTKLLMSEAARQEIERSLKRFAFLDQAGRQLASTLDYEETLAKIPGLAVPFLADWCVVHIVLPEGGLRRLPAVYASRQLKKTAEKLESEDGRHLPVAHLPKRGLIAQTIADQKSCLTMTVTDDWFARAAHSKLHEQLLRQLGITSHMIIPLLARQRCMGVISLVRLNDSPEYTTLDLALAEEFARRVAQEAERARLYSLAQWEIGERKKAQTELQQSEERFRALFEHSSDAVLLVDGRSRVLYASPSVEHVLGLRSEEILNKRFLSLVHPDDLSRLRQSFSQLLQQPGRAIRSEYRAKHKDGGWRWMEGVGNNLLATPSVQAIVVNFHDVTDRVKLERQKDEFLGIASHELKTPVTSLKAFTQILQRRLPPTDHQAQDYLVKMNNQMNRLTQLINELLDVTRIQSGHLALHIESFELGQLVGEIVDDFTRIAETSRFEVQNPQPITVKADRERIRQAVQNLISNAIKYTPSDKPIKVNLQTVKNRAIISVQDFGPGIKLEEQPKIFERFYQAADTGLAVGGLGLGLYIASEIAHRHKGSLTVKSAEGKGASFSLALPIDVR